MRFIREVNNSDMSNKNIIASRHASNFTNILYVFVSLLGDTDFQSTNDNNKNIILNTS